MSLPIPKMDILFLKFADRKGVVEIPLCEVIAGAYMREGGTHLFATPERKFGADTIKAEIGQFTNEDLGKYLLAELSGLGQLEHWIIQTENTPKDKSLTVFLETFNTK